MTFAPNFVCVNAEHFPFQYVEHLLFLQQDKEEFGLSFIIILSSLILQKCQITCPSIVQ